MFEHIFSDIVRYLSNKKRSFAITNLIEHVGSIVGIPDKNLDRMSSVNDVFSDRLGLEMQECLLWVPNELLEFGLQSFETSACTVISKTLFEPEIVPPLHGDQVAEPHVR